MDTDYSHLPVTEHLADYTRSLDDKQEALDKTDTCDVCEKEFLWKNLNWVGSTSCRICNDPKCSSEMNRRWREHCEEMDSERDREDEDYWD
jgi:hypothetical protein